MIRHHVHREVPLATESLAADHTCVGLVRVTVLQVGVEVMFSGKLHAARPAGKLAVLTLVAEVAVGELTSMLFSGHCFCFSIPGHWYTVPGYSSRIAAAPGAAGSWISRPVAPPAVR